MWNFFFFSRRLWESFPLAALLKNQFFIIVQEKLSPFSPGKFMYRLVKDLRELDSIFSSSSSLPNLDEGTSQIFALNSVSWCALRCIDEKCFYDPFCRVILSPREKLGSVRCYLNGMRSNSYYLQLLLSSCSVLCRSGSKLWHIFSHEVFLSFVPLLERALVFV